MDQVIIYTMVDEPELTSTKLPSGRTVKVNLSKDK